MPGASVVEKDDRFVQSGRRGARKRWGPQRVVRLDSLDPRVRAAVVALIRADEAARQSDEKSVTATNGDAQEVSSASSTTPTS
jgi:hypothetical protein